MSIISHINVLEEKHHQLEEKIADGISHHMPDEHITQLKKQKLRLKDEIIYLQKQQGLEAQAA